MYRDLLTQALGKVGTRRRSRRPAPGRPRGLPGQASRDGCGGTGGRGPGPGTFLRRRPDPAVRLPRCPRHTGWFDSPAPGTGPPGTRAGPPRHPASGTTAAPARHPAPNRRSGGCSAPRTAPRPSVESTAVPGDDERMVEAGGREVRVSRPDKIYFPGPRRHQVRPRLLLPRGRRAPAEHGRRAARHAAALPRRRHRQVLLPEAHSGRARPTGCSRPPSRRRTGRPPMRSSSPTSPTSSGR